MSDPVKEIRIGKIRAQVRANTTTDGEVWYGVNVCRLFEDKKGVQGTSNTYGVNDLLTVSEVMRQAFLWINEKVTAGE